MSGLGMDLFLKRKGGATLSLLDVPSLALGAL